MKRCSILLLLIATVAAAGAAVPSGDKTDPNVLIVVDHDGKEHKLKNWKFVSGTQKVPWLATGDDKAKDQGKKGGPAGAEMFVFSEGKVMYKKRVLTFVPLDSVRSIDYDYDPKKKEVTMRVAVSDKEADDEVLKGPIGYVGINVFGIEAQTDLGELGIAAVKFEGGMDKGIKSFRITHPKPVEAVPAGRVATIKTLDPKSPGFKAYDLQVLYHTGTAAKLTPHLYFKETVKVDLAKIGKLVPVTGSSTDFRLTLKDGTEQPPLVLLERLNDGDAKSKFMLEGLVGRAPCGWRLFPMAAIGELTFEEKAK